MVSDPACSKAIIAVTVVAFESLVVERLSGRGDQDFKRVSDWIVWSETATVPKAYSSGRDLQV